MLLLDSPVVIKLSSHNSNYVVIGRIRDLESSDGGPREFTDQLFKLDLGGTLLHSITADCTPLLLFITYVATKHPSLLRRKANGTLL